MRWPFGRVSASLVWGSAVAPPMTLLAAVAMAGVRGRHGALGALGGVLLVGQLCEPIVYGPSPAPEGRWARASVGANVALGALLVMTAIRRRCQV
jgi:hypothetical protein